MFWLQELCYWASGVIATTAVIDSCRTDQVITDDR